MWKPLLKSAIFGGIVVFVWCMISWMILPWHDMTTNSFTNQNELAKAILQNAPVNGVYVMPSMKPPLENPVKSSDQSQDNTAGQSDGSTGWNGPFVFANVVREGMAPNKMLRPMILALVTQFIGAFIIAWLLLQAKAMRYWHRVRFVTLTGFLVGFLSFMPLWTWWGFTGGYVIVGILDMIIAWFLAGLVIARVSKSK